MYKFILQETEDNKITNQEIVEIEERYNIKFPTVLRDYYLKYHGDKIKKSYVNNGKYKYGVSTIVLLKGQRNSYFGKLVEMDRRDQFIDSHFYPFARNEGGDYYYWDDRNEDIYLIYCDDIENPILICNSIQRFFEMMEGK